MSNEQEHEVLVIMYERRAAVTCSILLLVAILELASSLVTENLILTTNSRQLLFL